MTADPIRVEAVRGDVAESVHLIDVAVAGADGRLLASAGDPEAVAYLRSSAKPVQATVSMELGWQPPGMEQLAVACASHNGESVHVAAVRRTLEAAGVDESALRCPPAMPARGALPPEPARIFHNCSGKHAGMVAASIAAGLDPAAYLEPDGVIQTRVRERVEGLTGAAARAVASDGCGARTFAFALHEMAAMFARLPGWCGAALEAMRAHPYLVAGEARLCTATMRSGAPVVLKVGAEGLLCGVMLDDGRGFAIKSRDGTARGREEAAVWLLNTLGAVDDATKAEILGEVMPPLLGTSGAQPMMRVQGELRTA